MAIDKIFNDANVDGIADNIFGAVNNSVSEVKQMQQRKAAENVQMVVEAFKKIETNITEKFDNVTDVIEKRVLTIKDGRDGKPGRDGVNGKQGTPGTPGKDGTDGVDGVSVTDASIDFDGSLVISLSSGQQINVGEVVPPELERQLVELRQGGGSAGTVTSVAMTVPTLLSVSGSPITSSGTLALTYSGTALPVANGGTGITSFGSGVATWLGTPSSANLAAAVTDETGSGALVFGTSPTFTTSLVAASSTMALLNTTATTVNAFGAATAVNIGAATGTLTVANTTLAAKAITASTTLQVAGDTSLATTPVLYSGDGSVSSGRLLGRYSYRTATPTTAYYYDLNNTNTITSSDSLAANKLATLIDSTITNANALTAFGTSYGGKAAGLSFVSGTASDILLAAIGSAPLLNADINAVVVGYTSVGPRIAIQNYALNDDTANAISYIGAVHRFYPAGTEVANISSTGLAVTGTLSATGTLTGGTSGTGYSFSGSAPATSLTLDSSGNLGVGAAPVVRLDVAGAASSNNDARFVAKFADTSAVAQGNGGGIMFRGVYTGTTLVDASGIQAYKVNATDNNYSYGLAFSTRANGGNLTTNMRLDESGNLTVSTGNLVIGTAGKGIDFSATASGSGTMTSELLADYEEGTFTATLKGSTTDPTTPVTTTGTYTKVGRLVYIDINFENVTTTGAAGDVTVSGLPFTSSNIRYTGSALSYLFDLNTGTSLSAFLSGGSTTVFYYSSKTLTGWQDLKHSAGTSRYLITSFSYNV